jgi:hypothetical protein
MSKLHLFKCYMQQNQQKKKTYTKSVSRCSGEAVGDLLAEEAGAQQLTISGMLEAVGVHSIVGFVIMGTNGHSRHLSVVLQRRAAALQSYRMGLEGGGDV